MSTSFRTKNKQNIEIDQNTKQNQFFNNESTQNSKHQSSLPVIVGQDYFYSQTTHQCQYRQSIINRNDFYTSSRQRTPKVERKKRKISSVVFVLIALVSICQMFYLYSLGLLSFGNATFQGYNQDMKGFKDIPVFKKRADPKNYNDLKTQYNFYPNNNQIVLFRILGNDLVPRHKLGQTLENLRFILKYEAPFENCDKKWIVNRIFNKTMEKEIINELQKHDQSFIRIPFDEVEYLHRDWDLDSLPNSMFITKPKFKTFPREKKARAVDVLYNHKNLYAMNGNGARNTALKEGKRLGYRWILPWDGNCFLTSSAWSQIYNSTVLNQNDHQIQYIVVPMARMLDNTDLFNPKFRPKPVEEPQLIFKNTSTQYFNEKLRYGRRPKVELLIRLGIPGPWLHWSTDPWEEDHTYHVKHQVPDKSLFTYSGWVARLFSGKKHLESQGQLINRGHSRLDAIRQFLDNIDENIFRKQYFNSDNLFTFNETLLEQYRQQFAPIINMKSKGRKLNLEQEKFYLLYSTVIYNAKIALIRGPYSPLNKTNIPPSGSKQDYFSVPPYWWSTTSDTRKPPIDNQFLSSIRPTDKIKSLSTEGLDSLDGKLKNTENQSDSNDWIHKDDQRVPETQLFSKESEKYDRSRIQLVFEDTTALSLAWYFTGNTDYSDRAVEILRMWFINKKTSMKPHLTFAQYRRGKRNFGGGIVDTKDLYYLLDAVRIISKSPSWTSNDEKHFRKWTQSFLRWLINTRKGLSAREKQNNLGTIYDLQVAALAAFTNEFRLFYHTLRMSKMRLLTQFNTNGEQILEKLRKRSIHYQLYNINAWINLARIGSSGGIDLWHWNTDKFTSSKSQKYGPLYNGIKYLASINLDKFRKRNEKDPYEDVQQQIQMIEYIRYVLCKQYCYDNTIDQVFRDYSCADLEFRLPVCFGSETGVKPYWMLSYKVVPSSTRVPPE